MENSDIITQDFYALIEACDKYLPYKSRNLRPGEPPVIEEPKPEPPKPLLLPPPKKQYDRTDSFRVRFLTDPETGYRLITSRRLRIWLFGDSTRFEYGEDGTCVFAQGPEIELSDELKEKFGYDPLKFPPHILDLRKRRLRLKWSSQEQSVFYISLMHFIPIEWLSWLFGREGYGLIDRNSRRGYLRYRYKEKLKDSPRWQGGWQGNGLMQELMLRNNTILNILETPHYQGKLAKRIRIIE